MSVLFVGHGSVNQKSNEVYRQLLAKLKDAGFSNISAVLLSDGKKALDKAFAELPKSEPVKIVPLMVANGNHVINQIYGDSEESIKTMLETAGFEVVVFEKSILEHIIEKELYLTFWGDILE